MNFKELAQYPVTVRVEVGEGFEMTVDANKYNGECFRRLARTYKRCAEDFEASRDVASAEPPEERTLADAVLRYEAQLELSAITSDIQAEQYADVLASDRHGILMDWEQYEDGRKVPPTFENLMQVPGVTLRAIFETGREAANPKSQGTPTQTQPSPMTPETISDGSSDPTTPLHASPTM